VRYPLKHKPAWGNLIFVPNEDLARFDQYLHDHLAALRKSEMKEGIKNSLKKIPGLLSGYRALKKIASRGPR
jgi:hypothetical protein